jgi:glycosyltransferase involved in cell wall biosynthesis
MREFARFPLGRTSGARPFPRRASPPPPQQGNGRVCRGAEAPQRCAMTSEVGPSCEGAQVLDKGDPDPNSRVELCCYLDALDLGGTENSLAALLSALPSRYDVTLLGRSVGVLTYVAKARPGTAIRLVPSIRGKSDLVGIASQVKILRRIRPDLIHISLGHPYQMPYIVFAAAVTRTPALVVVHGIFDWPRRPQDAIVRWLIRRVRVVAGVSRYVCRSIESEYGLGMGNARLLYNGIESSVDPSPAVASSGDGVTVLGGVGRLASEKGYDVLLRAMTELPECRLVLLGEGSMRTELTELATDLGIADRVEFVGWVDPPWATRWTFDILIAPSRVEGFGLVAVEAMRAGIPVIASGVGGFFEIIDDGDTGLLVEPENPSALAAAIRRLGQDPEERAAMAERARSSVNGRFSTQAMAEQYTEVFEEVRRR